MFLNFMKPHHFAISVSDINETIKWYEEKLEFKLEKRFARKDLGCQVALMSFNGIRLEIFCFENSTALPEYRKTLAGDLMVQGMKHFTFSVKDIYSAVSELKKRNVKFIQKPSLGGSNHMYAFFVDINGIMIELIEEGEYKP